MRLYPIYFLLLVLMSCQPNTDAVTKSAENQPGITGKWQLSKIVPTSMIPGKENTPVNLPYEEYYEFNPDSTFSRYRSNGYKATGTYSFKQYSPDDYGIVATFDDKDLSYHELSGDKIYSYTEGQVYLKQSEPGLFIESYVASDGPAFHYRKTEQAN